jgi:ketosteroid isomerase-like protein
MKTHASQSPVFTDPQNRLRPRSVTSVGNGTPVNGAALERVTPDQVREAVCSFWETWKAKSAEALADAYSTSSVTFRAGSVSMEPGFMGIAQRSREYFHEACSIEYELGPIEVVLLSETTAIAIYSFYFRALNRAMAAAHGTLQEEIVPYGRATHVFRRDPDGKLRILHEHVSNAV